MEIVWKWLDHFWNDNRLLAWILCLSSIALASWAFAYPKPPGVSIGLLALVAGIMSVRPKMHTSEKFAWVAVLIVFAYLEVRAIRKADEANKQASVEQRLAFSKVFSAQDEDFKKTSADLKSVINRSQDQFKATLAGIVKNALTTDSVLKQTNENLLDITGGDSFGYVIPGTADSSPIVMILHNDGDRQLSGVHLRILYIPGPSCTVWGEIMSGCMERQEDVLAEPLDMGAVAPKSSMRVPPLFSTNINSNQMAHYRIEIRAQNGVAYENIWFRPSSAGSGIAYRFDVIRKVIGKPRHGDVSVNSGTFRLLEKVDWTDIRPLHVSIY